ncbi:MAG: Clp protease ClpP [Desulfurellales bacterium]|nr:MAG: Clp protease ClpP [Desulfurellales bacterium]
MTVRFQAKGSRGEIWLYDQVGASFFGDGVSAKSFQKDLSALGKVSTINLHINSPGGDVFDGIAIYNMLAQHPARVEVDIDGIAASIASIIAMAGNEIRIAKNAQMMIHNPRGFAAGDESEMLRVAELLKNVKTNLVDTYRDRTGNDPKALADWMDAETWFSADAAVQHGFATTVTRETAVTACFGLLNDYRNVPDALKRRLQGSAQQTELDARRIAIEEQGRRLASRLA